MTASSIAQNNYLSFSQFMKLSKMNSNEFENYALKNGMRLLDNIYDKYFYKIIYAKTNNTLLFYTSKGGDPLNMVEYQTKNYNEYLKLKNECLNFGFKFIQSNNAMETINYKVVFQIYKSKTQQLSFHTSQDGWYCIGISPIDFEKNYFLKFGNLNH